MLDAPNPPGVLLWRVSMDGKVAEARLRLTREGRELYVTIGEQMWFAHPFPDGTPGDAIAAESDGTLNNLLGHGCGTPHL